MAAQDWDLSITQVSPSFTYSPAPPAGTTGYELATNKKITLAVDPSISGAVITQVWVYADDGNNQKTGSPLGTWTSSANGTNKVDVNHNGTKIYEVKGKNDGTVEIKDTESQDGDEKYHFGAQVTVGTTPYDGDPEMINKGRIL